MIEKVLGFLFSLFYRKQAAPRKDNFAEQEYEIAESIYSIWSYHISLKGSKESLCGKLVMRTRIPMSAWGDRTELNEKWCLICKRKYDAEKSGVE